MKWPLQMLNHKDLKDLKGHAYLRGLRGLCGSDGLIFLIGYPNLESTLTEVGAGHNLILCRNTNTPTR